MGWNLNYELIEVWHSILWQFSALCRSKHCSFYGQKSVFRFESKTLISQRFFNRSFVKTSRTAIRPTVLSSLRPILIIPITLRNIYFLTHFRIFCKGLHHSFLQKVVKTKHFQILMPMDGELNNELNEVWHSAFGPLFSLRQPKCWTKILFFSVFLTLLNKT